MGEKIWYCIRTSGDNAEVETYAEPVEEILRMPNVFSPISITVQPRNGFTDRLAYGETTTKDQRIILSPYEFWHKKFKEGDVFYLDGQKPSEDEEYFGQNANYMVESVGNQNEAIELLVKKIINK
ncbi:MAG: hypothetical protein ACI4PF_01120 [Christensenellales bacterium]